MAKQQLRALHANTSEGANENSPLVETAAHLVEHKSENPHSPLSTTQIDHLKHEYGAHKTISTENGKKLSDKIGQFKPHAIHQLAHAKIPFVSGLAHNHIIREKMKHENPETRDYSRGAEYAMSKSDADHASRMITHHTAAHAQESDPAQKAEHHKAIQYFKHVVGTHNAKYESKSD